MAGLTLDSGALIALEKKKRIVWAFLKEALFRQVPVTIPSIVLAQTWRKSPPRLAQVLKGALVVDLDEGQAKRVGVLLGKARTKDIVDAHVVLVAGDRRSIVLTSDKADLDRLASQVEKKPTIVAI